jgi:hypothetical protein
LLGVVFDHCVANTKSEGVACEATRRVCHVSERKNLIES